ncbi:PEGA domain-containing protein [Candidatus Saccharibacteria bacterium]|nr:PEGA domain-containing protein [Candidatus Saccharibacteria bacterium]
MDKEHKKKMHTIKVIITEIVMVLVAIVTVIVLTFLAMGYNVNRNGELGQSGLLQLKSIPTGAMVEIDGEIMFSKTNMSRMLSEGKHKLVVSKDGYDTWEKEIVSDPGWLLKLDYPRLFLKERTPEKIRDTENLQFVSMDDGGTQILYATNNDKWQLLNIRGDEVSEQSLNVSEYIGKEAQITNIKWNKNSDKVLVRAKNKENIEWSLINLKNIDSSLNLTQKFAFNFDMIEFSTDSGERLIVLENGNLRSILASERTVSQVMAKNVESFYNNDTNLAYITISGTKKNLMLYQEGPNDILVTELNNASKVKVSLSDYLNKKYISFTIDSRLFIYRGEYPTTERTLSDMELVVEKDVKFIPDELVVWTEDQLIMAKSGKNIAMFNAELSELSEYEVEGENAFFLAPYLVGVTANGQLIARDFDGNNRRELAVAELRATISKNNKWLYYLNTVDSKVAIYREKIMD